ncbi:ABC transporter permease [Dactylosporangium vinaceum]|uniref:Transport permease protein n=1 Tax=Dactylosporangium vinaceum TaxID=53362 RepID=A0ABV5ML79_9ACTN|nr:ABC transporter permease [Dactylosporangium vinaceum]
MTTAVVALPRRPTRPIAFAVEVAAVVGRRLRHLYRTPARFIGVTLNPLVSMIVLGYLFKQSIVIPGGGSYQEYLFAGVAIQVGLAGVGPTAVAVATDMSRGLVDRLRSLPISRSAFLVGHTIADLLIGLLGLAVVTGFGVLIGWRTHASLLAVVAGFAVLAVFIYVMLWVGVLLGMSMKDAESVDSIAPLIVVVLPFLSSAFLAADNLPRWLAPVAAWNPLSTVTHVLRTLWGNPTSASSRWVTDHAGAVSLVSLGLLFAVACWVSVRRYRSTEA